jgi:hypothetical protein
LCVDGISALKLKLSLKLAVTAKFQFSFLLKYYLTEMSTGNLPGGKGRPARKADNLIANCEPIV